MADKIDDLTEKMDNVTEKVSGIDTKLEVHLAKFEAHVDGERDRWEALNHNTKILQENTESLKEHMQRTDLLENYVKKIDERFTPVEIAAQHKLAVANWWKNTLVLIAKIGGALTAGTVILKTLLVLLAQD